MLLVFVNIFIIQNDQVHNVGSYSLAHISYRVVEIKIILMPNYDTGYVSGP